MKFRIWIGVFFIGVLNEVVSIDIEGQLTVIRNDCYERLAIGERLNPRKVYKTFDYNTVSDCEMECTKEKESCRAFSIGIGLKGNGTCELSKEPVRESADLKPLGTVSDTDYDLYIKKLDCQLVIEKPNFHPPRPPHEAEKDHQGTNNHGYEEAATGYHHNAVKYGSDYHKPHHGLDKDYRPPYDHVNRPLPHDEQNGYDYPKPQQHPPPKPYPPSQRPPNQRPSNENTHQVQTIVSIASGPQSYLHPTHDIIVSNGPQPGPNPGVQLQHSSSYGRPVNSNPNVFTNRYPPNHNNRPYQDDIKPQGNIPPPYGTDIHDRKPPPHKNPYGTPLNLYPPEEPNHNYNINSQYGNKRPPIYENPKAPYDRPNTNYIGDKRKPISVSVGPVPSYGKPIHAADEVYGNKRKPSLHHRPTYYDPYGLYGQEFWGGDNYYEGEKGYFNQYGGGYNYDKPLIAPYLPLDPDRPDPQNNGKPPNFNSLFSSYGSGGGEGAEYFSVNRRKYDLYEAESHRFADYPPRRPSQPNFYDRYDKRFPGRPTRYGSLIPHPNDYDKNDQHYDKNQYYEYLFKPDYEDRYEIDLKLLPEKESMSKNHFDATTEKVPKTKSPGNVIHIDDANRKNDRKKNGPPQNSIVSQDVDKKGQHITSIITLIDEACFRRAFAGKRVIRGLVRQLILCDTVEQCQQECADQKKFTCEGFNYRIDPTGRGKGECELLDLPLSRINIPRDLIIDPDYDVYIRDRNAAAVNCKQPPAGSSYFAGSFEDDWDYKGDHHYADSFEYEDNFDRRGVRPYRPSPPLTPQPAPPPPPARRPLPPNDLDPILRRPGDRWQGDRYRGPKLPPDTPPVDGYLISGPRPDVDRRHDFNRPDYHEDGEYFHHHNLHETHRDDTHSFHYKNHYIDRHDYHGHTPGIHYLPASRPYHDRIPLDVPRPLKPSTVQSWGSYGGTYGNFGDRNSYYGDINRYRDQNRFGENRRITYLPVPPPPKDWGLYGGSYGTGGVSLQYQGFGDKQNSYWGFQKHQETNFGNDRNFIIVKRPPYLPIKPIVQELDNFILPVEPRRPLPHNFIKDECSLRMAPGFRLHKRIVKKYFVVADIHECELLCVKEKDFACSSYAFRYTISLNIPTDNCYLSDRNFKELDYYIDLEPDRDFDVYTMNNREKCGEPVDYGGRDRSECFWRVRSGQRLDHTVVRDSLKVNSIVECQLECLRSQRFTCRAYSFRYGSPIIGGIIDNCQLTNWPFYELDPQRHFISEPGFEVYERGSFGHGCQPDHFRISGKHIDQDVKIDTVCYVGFAQAARLLPAATIKSLFVPTELDCKNECSKYRRRSPLKCMTFSFRSSGPLTQSNCYLSHIMQRDLLPKIDYIEDPTSWLFTWDNYNPECIDVYNKKPYDTYDDSNGERGREIPGYGGGYDLDFYNSLNTWRVYSVNGWPCRKGTTCKENIEAGFWFCYLEGEDRTAWDYCCRPDHQCGLSREYPYEWCYVGPERTQWRKCSDRYYPYFYYNTDRFDNVKPSKPWLPDTGYLRPPPFRPDRPPADPTEPPSKPSLDQYENEFDNQFLSPPKPGGFGMPRRWPVSYLHKEMPPNNTEPQSRSMKKDGKNSKITAINNLIDIIKNNDFKNVEYHIANNSNKADDVLFVKIPLPVNLTSKSISTTEKVVSKQEATSKQPNIKIKTSNGQNTPTGKSINEQEWDIFDTNFQRTTKSISQHEWNQPEKSQDELKKNKFTNNQSTEKSQNWRESLFQRNVNSPGYRKGYVTRTNVTRTRRFDQEFF